jgi:anthranilate phosphoribosyltransferase
VNPAGARSQLIGAPSLDAAKVMAEALAELGTRRSFVVHGQDGLDEITITAATDVYEVTGHQVVKYVWKPSDFGVQTAQLSSLKGGDSSCNAQVVLGVLRRTQGPCRDIVLVNAAAGLLAAGLAGDLRSGMELAVRSIDSGAASAKLELLKTNFPSA